MLVNEEFKKKPNESEQDYIIRMCESKIAFGVTWEELAFIINNEIHENLSERSYRRKYNEWIKSNATTVDELAEIKKERFKLRDEISQANALLRLEAREEQMRETAIEAAKEVAKSKSLIIPEPVLGSKNNSKKGILLIGDWHYGIDINVFYNVYNPTVCRNRVKALAVKCLDIIEKEDLQEIYVLNLGDMISGRIHLPLRINSRCDTVTQTMEVSELIAEFLSILSEFVEINYFSVLDNHARVEPKKKESLQTESFARIIDWYLIERLRPNANITFYNNSYGDDLCTFTLFDYTIAAVHGDKDKVNKVITNLNMFTQQHIDLILTAHTHHFNADESNETLRLCNGSLMGCDEYANDLRLNSKPSQLFIISNENNLTECIYKINLD